MVTYIEIITIIAVMEAIVIVALIMRIKILVQELDNVKWWKNHEADNADFWRNRYIKVAEVVNNRNQVQDNTPEDYIMD